MAGVPNTDQAIIENRKITDISYRAIIRPDARKRHSLRPLGLIAPSGEGCATLSSVTPNPEP